MGEDTPTPEEPENLQEFLNKMLGGEQGAEEFFASIEDPMKEAFVGFHEIFNGLQSGGFSKQEALYICGIYLYQVVSGQESS